MSPLNRLGLRSKVFITQGRTLNLFFKVSALAARLHETDVPDPNYGNIEGFEKVLDLCEAGAKGLVSQLTESVRE